MKFPFIREIDTVRSGRETDSLQHLNSTKTPFVYLSAFLTTVTSYHPFDSSAPALGGA